MSRDAFIEVYPDAAGEWRWRKIGGNGEPTTHGESHPHPSGAVSAARREYPDLQIRRLTSGDRPHD